MTPRPTATAAARSGARLLFPLTSRPAATAAARSGARLLFPLASRPAAATAARSGARLLLPLLLAATAAPAARALDNGLGLTPALAWSTWNRFALAINESLVLDIADALVATGLASAGFRQVNVDAGAWLPMRDADGNLQANPALFPSGMAALADGLHTRGLRLGVYTDLGTGSCGPGPGSGGHWAQDAAFFAKIGADYLKVDFCGQPQTYEPAAELAAWAAVAASLNATGRPIYLSICPKSDLPANTTGALAPFAGQGGLYFPPQVWTAVQKRAVANAWLVEVRNNVDAWSPSSGSPCVNVGKPCGMLTNIDSQVTLGKWEETGPGGLVDADMLEVCQFNGTYNTPGMSASEGRLHYLTWVILPSPLILTCDVRTLNATAPGRECLAMLLNDELLSINQDPLVAGARLLRAGASPSPPRSSDDVTFQVFGRPLAAPGVFAAALLNRADTPLEITLDFAELGLPRPSGSAAVRDVGARADRGSFSGSWQTTVPARDAVLVTVTQAAA
jgi:alpha-galactosidase